jgi:hypothetical protein
MRNDAMVLAKEDLFIGAGLAVVGFASGWFGKQYYDTRKAKPSKAEDKAASDLAAAAGTTTGAATPDSKAA